ncbi:MAG: peptidase T [Myxococcales bacterium]|nr:MAG: peptidase T [Myxococcales bacterium]
MRALNDPNVILRSTRLVDAFVELARIDTQSDEKSPAWPSTPGQRTGLEAVRRKLTERGLADAAIDKNGYLFATLPGNRKGAPVIGLIAHIDTSPDYSGKDVSPVAHANYQGETLALKNGVTISPEESPWLTQCVGDTILTADGTTLLGADDKAGVAEILAALEYLHANPDLPRPTVRVAITPDEEIGRGAEKFDVERFGAHCAYTLDGGFSGEVNGETFSADSAAVAIAGVAVHPGTAKGKLVNAIRWAAAFVESLPPDESPEKTEGRQGFYHPTRISGNASEAKVSLILRDFELGKLTARGDAIRRLAEELRRREPRLGVTVEITETYRNMAYWLKDRPEVMDRLVEAVKLVGIEPRVEPIRGGTDGSGLTAKGLPTPNIFTGGVNYHGPQEWISTRVMAQAVCVTLNLIQLWAEK